MTADNSRNDGPPYDRVPRNRFLGINYRQTTWWRQLRGWRFALATMGDGWQFLPSLGALGIFYFWLVKRFVRVLLAVMILLFAILFILGFVENASDGFYTASIKSLFNSINYFYGFLPFIFILATILFFSGLQEKSELTAARVLSFSPWQVVIPVLSVAFLFGIFYIFAFSPISAKVHQRWNNLGKTNDIATTVDVIDKEFWLKEKLSNNIFADRPDTSLKNFNGSLIIHGYSLLDKDKKLKNAQFFFISNEGVIKVIMLAKEATLDNNQWQMTSVTRYEPGQPVTNLDKESVPSLLNSQSIKDLLLDPEDLSIYRLNKYLEEVENLGFSTYPYEVYFHRLLSLPFVLLSMSLLAAGFSFHSKGRGQRIQTLLIAIVLGFFIHFFFEIVRAFIISQELPSFLTAWVPTAMIMLLSTALFLHREEN